MINFGTQDRCYKHLIQKDSDNLILLELKEEAEYLGFSVIPEEVIREKMVKALMTFLECDEQNTEAWKVLLSDRLKQENISFGRDKLEGVNFTFTFYFTFKRF